MSKLLKYPSNLSDPGTNPSFIQFAFFDRKSPKESSPTDTVHLYMPESVAQPSTVSWDSEAFGYIGNAIRKGAHAFAGASEDDIVGAAMAALQANSPEYGLGGLNLMESRALASVGSAAASLMGGSVSADGLLADVAKKVPNPYLTMIFRGVNFRDFSFVFKFFPRSEADCDTIHNIIKTFRGNALPEYEHEDVFLGYPNECQITYMWNGKRNPWLHRFKRSVCTAVDVDYTSSGMFTTMRNGFPAEITMSTKWSEIELVTRGDVNGEGEAGGY